jgi:hypothetical protein
VADSPNLRRLASLAAEVQIDCLAAAIPALCVDELGQIVDRLSRITIAQHGFRHQNHEPEGAAKSEFGPARSAEEVYHEISDGFTRLQELFGPRFAPVFVGPWNRCAPVHAGALVDIGLRGWSGFASDPRRPTHPQLRGVDVHVDVLEWSDSPKIQPLELICAKLADAVAAVERRPRGAQSLEVPIGILTHHRVFDEAAWSVLMRLIELISDASGGAWSSPLDLFRLKQRQGASAANP